MKTLFLHIGTGKTGSTSIQKTFNSLQSESFFFQYDKWARPIKEDLEGFINRVNKDSCNHVIYSCEWLFQLDEPLLTLLSKRLKALFKVKIVLYLRRQDEFAVSMYQQISKKRNSNPQHGSIALPLNYCDTILDYKNICAKWVRHFGKENVTIRIFSRETLKDGCVVKDFANVVGEPVKRGDIVTANKSVGVISFKLAHILKPFKIDPKIYRKVVFGAPKSVKALPSRKTAELFYQSYIEHNRQIKNEYNITSQYDSVFNDDFSRYPVERTDLWTEETATLAITHLYTILAENFPKTEAAALLYQNYTQGNNSFRLKSKNSAMAGRKLSQYPLCRPDKLTEQSANEIMTQLCRLLLPDEKRENNSRGTDLFIQRIRSITKRYAGLLRDKMPT